MRPAADSTCTTRNGRRTRPRRSSTACWRWHPRCRICVDPIAADLRCRGLTRDRVLALALHLLDLGYFRAGSEQYAEENNSFGIATLLCEHVTLQREAVEFDYPAKSGVRRTLIIDDPEVVRSVRALVRRPDRTDRLLVCRNSPPQAGGAPTGWADIHADDLNARFKQRVGEEYTVKDLRTCHGTVLAAAAFVAADPPVNKTVIKRVESAVNERGRRGTRMVQGYEHGLTIAPGVRRADQASGRASSHSRAKHGTVDPQDRQQLETVRPASTVGRRPAPAGRRCVGYRPQSGPTNNGRGHDRVRPRLGSAAETRRASSD
jgi:Eukaryotic DNA topoisomerase I, catalytic core